MESWAAIEKKDFFNLVGSVFSFLTNDFLDQSPLGGDDDIAFIQKNLFILENDH